MRPPAAALLLCCSAAIARLASAGNIEVPVALAVALRGSRAKGGPPKRSGDLGGGGEQIMEAVWEHESTVVIRASDRHLGSSTSAGAAQAE